MQSVLVTGATGFLGGRLCATLRAHGYDVIAHGRARSGCRALQDQGFQVVRHDLTGPLTSEAGRTLRACGAIVHCAALSAPFGRRQDFVEANVTATRHLLAACAGSDVERFVCISSPSVYFSFQDQLDVTESAVLPRPVNAYAETKRMAEKLVLGTSGISTICLRPRGIYGHGDTALLPRLLSAARRGALPLMRQGRARIDLTHVDDVIAAILAALQAPPEVSGEIFNISGGEALPLTHIVGQACARAHVVPAWKPVPVSAALGAAWAFETIAKCMPHRPEPRITRYAVGLFAYEQSLSIAKAGRILKWSPQISFEQGLDETFAEFRGS